MPLTEEQKANASHAASPRNSATVSTVNLGIGMPTLVANTSARMDVILQSENGMLGVGPYPLESEVDPTHQRRQWKPSPSFPAPVISPPPILFAMIARARGPHRPGALQVDEKGTLANWRHPRQNAERHGGAMDLGCGCERVFIAMEHATSRQQAQNPEKVHLPLTGVEVVDHIRHRTRL